MVVVSDVTSDSRGCSSARTYRRLRSRAVARSFQRISIPFGELMPDGELAIAPPTVQSEVPEDEGERRDLVPEHNLVHAGLGPAGLLCGDRRAIHCRRFSHERVPATSVVRIRRVNKTQTASRAEAAARKLREAEHLERRRPIDWSEAALNPLHAERIRQEGERLLAAPERLTGDATTELVPTDEAEVPGSQARAYLVDTLQEPNVISVAAADQRAYAATRANVLAPALDAAVSARAKNSIEKMLCHQLAACSASPPTIVHAQVVGDLTCLCWPSGLRRPDTRSVCPSASRRP